MKDPRIKKLAQGLVNYSCAVKKGDKVMIEAFDVGDEIVSALVEETRKAGGYPVVNIRSYSVRRAMLMNADREQIETLARYDNAVMKEMDAYIGIRGGSNPYELSDVPAENMKMFDELYNLPVHHETRVKHTRWVVLRYPTPAMAQQSVTSNEAFEDFYFDVCNLDYSKMSKAMDALSALMNKTDRVRLVAKDTDLSFSIKGIGSEKCAGEKNIPDGEVYTAPVKTSVNGYITYNAPSVNRGIRFENIRLDFKDGKIVKATAGANTEELNAIFDTDEGARYVGEFAIGVNPYINKPMGDILFDEKISGSIHFTPGACYDECPNGNNSSVHWDLVLIQTPQYGGGEIWFDDVLIRKDGVFVLDELKALNPENLK